MLPAHAEAGWLAGARPTAAAQCPSPRCCPQPTSPLGPPEGSAHVLTRAITPSPRPVRQESSVHNVLKTSKHRLCEGAETEDMCKLQRPRAGPPQG